MTMEIPPKKLTLTWEPFHYSIKLSIKGFVVWVVLFVCLRLVGLFGLFCFVGFCFFGQLGFFCGCFIFCLFFEATDRFRRTSRWA